MSNTLKGGIVVAVVLAAAATAQAVRSDSASQPTTDASHSIQAQPGTSSGLAALLNRSCGDCHSSTVVSGWYTRVPPFSTVMARGAREGRKAINFAEWTGYSPEQQRALLVASCTDATLDKMPMKSYLRFRPDARLSTADVETICAAAGQINSSATRQ